MKCFLPLHLLILNIIQTAVSGTISSSSSVTYIDITFPCSADHEQDWQPYPVDPYPCAICATIHSYYMVLSHLFV